MLAPWEESYDQHNRQHIKHIGSILKSKGITLPTKVHIVKVVVFPVVTYGFKSWTIKKAECQRIDAFVLFCFVFELMPLNCGAGENS